MDTLAAGWSVGNAPAAVHGRTSWDTSPGPVSSWTLGHLQGVVRLHSAPGVCSRQFPQERRLDLTPLTSTQSLQGQPQAPLPTSLSLSVSLIFPPDGGVISSLRF